MNGDSSQDSDWKVHQTKGENVRYASSSMVLVDNGASRLKQVVPVRLMEESFTHLRRNRSRTNRNCRFSFVQGPIQASTFRNPEFSFVYLISPAQYRIVEIACVFGFQRDLRLLRSIICERAARDGGLRLYLRGLNLF